MLFRSRCFAYSLSHCFAVSLFRCLIVSLFRRLVVSLFRYFVSKVTPHRSDPSRSWARGTPGSTPGQYTSRNCPTRSAPRWRVATTTPWRCLPTPGYGRGGGGCTASSASVGSRTSSCQVTWRLSTHRKWRNLQRAIPTVPCSPHRWEDSFVMTSWQPCMLWRHSAQRPFWW